MQPETSSCPTCGFTLTLPVGECPNCGAISVSPPPPPTSQLCPRCGQVNLPQARFCTSCGLPLTGETPSPPPPPVVPMAPVTPNPLTGQVSSLSEKKVLPPGPAATPAPVSTLWLNLAWLGLAFGLVLMGVSILWIFISQTALSGRPFAVPQPTPSPIAPLTATSAPVVNLPPQPTATAMLAPTIPPTATLAPLPTLPSTTTASPTSSGLVLPTIPPISLIPPSYQCADLSQLELQIGFLAQVRRYTVNLRSEPKVSSPDKANVLRSLKVGERVWVMEGPTCTSGGTWWKVLSESGETGWVREIQPGLKRLWEIILP